jgi:aconitate hydratase 2/2-methylisocitrate dehydratase
MPPTIMTGPKEKATNPCMLCGVNGTLDLEDSMICEACGYATLPTSEKTTSHHSKFLESYAQHVQERASMAHGFGVAPKPLSPAQVQALLEEFQSDACSAQERETLLQLLSYRVPPGVDQAAQYKAEFLSAIAKQDKNHPNLSQMQAIELLGTMLGGYNVKPLVDLLNHDDYSVASAAAQQLKYTLLIFDAFESIEELHKSGCQAATAVLESWAAAEWFLEKPKVPNKITITVFKVQGETNTDDLSPAPNAWSRPDIPLHATCMLKNPRDGIHPVEQGEVGPLAQIEDLREKGFPLAYVGDVVGTGSSRKSATNSVLWFMGEEIPHVPNIKRGGICIGGKIAPIFFNTMQDSGALPIEMDVSKLSMGDVVDIYPYDGRVCRNNSDEVLATFSLKSPVLLDEVRAGGRIPLIIGRSLTAKARESLGRNAALDDVFCSPPGPDHIPGGWTLAQKMVGKACGLEGVAPGQYCEPRITTVGSQDTTGPMTRDELKSLACLKFSAGLVMQSFCHTAAYPKKVDLAMHRTLPKFFCSRGGVALKPGDGIIHSWLNRMILPDTVGELNMILS